MVQALHREIVGAGLAISLVVGLPIAYPGEPERSMLGAVRAVGADPRPPPCPVVPRRPWSDPDGWIVQRLPDCG
jgi:hypothetical protein